MTKLKLLDGTTYRIADYSTQNNFSIILDGTIPSDVLVKFTENNLSKIQFLTSNGAVTGTYYNKLLCGYVDNSDTLTININDADLCRYGLILNEENRIIDFLTQRYAPIDAIIVNDLPKGNLSDYQYANNEFIYNPLPKEEIVEQPSQLDIIEAKVAYIAMMTNLTEVI